MTWSELLRRVGDVGASPSPDPWLTRYVRRSNHIGAFFALCSLPAFLMGALAAPVLAPVVLVTLAGYLSPLFFNRKRLHGLARAAPILAANLAITAFTLVLGREIQAHAALFVVATLPFVLFDVREKTTIVLLEILSAGLYLALVLTDRAPWGQVSFTHPLQIAIRTACVVAEFASLALLLGIFFTYQRRQYDQLEATVSDLQIQIDRRAKVEGELVHAKELAEAGARAKSEFLATMSHELRTPMNAVLGAASLLRESALEQEQNDMLQTIETAGQSLLTLLNDVLDLSMADLGGIQLCEQIFNPHEVVEGTLLALGPLAEKKGLDLALETRPGIPAEALGDVTRLRQTLSKLLGNALKFTSQGFVRVLLETAPRGERDLTLRISIMDSGVGIPKDVQGQLFTIFTQSDRSNTRAFGGTGLGLALSQRLVQRMGGRIGMQSIEGTGSTFWFEVPVAMRRPAEASHLLDGQKVMVVSRGRALGPSLRAAFAGAGGTLVEAIEPGTQVYVDPRDQTPEELDTLYLRVRTEGAHLVVLGQRDAAIPPEAMVLPRLSRRARVLDLAAKLAKRHSGERLTRTGRYLVPLPSLKNAEAPRVLLVEDNAVNQMIVKAALNKMGAQCTVAGNGRVALEELARATFDLVLMDIQMPVMDGYEATRAIRARETSGFRMPIVALTANTTLEDRESAFAAGMDAFLTKPVRIEELRATVVNLTERQRAAAVMS